MQTKFLGRVFAAAALVASAAVAQPAAAQFSQLNITGSVNVYQTTAGLAENFIIDFLTPAGGGVGTIKTTDAIGDQTGVFAGLDGTLTPGTNIDFIFGTAALPAPTTTPVPFLTVGGFTFTALTFGPGGGPAAPLALSYDGVTTTVTLSVRGTVTGPSFTGTRNFTGAYTTQFPGRTPTSLITQIANSTGPASGVINKSISATFLVAVPEPATIGLMGTGLVALFGLGLRRRQNV